MNTMNSTRELSKRKEIVVGNEETRAEITFNKIRETDTKLDLWWGEYYQGTIHKDKNMIGYYNENVTIEFNVPRSKVRSLIKELSFM